MKTALIFKKTKAQLEREKKNKKNLKKNIAELNGVVARIRKWREQVEKELQNHYSNLSNRVNYLEKKILK
jgi:hypothetical protein